MKHFAPTVSANSLADQLRKMVAGMPAGARLPTVRKLMSDHGVSQHLVQSALAQLRAEGAVASHVGRGTFVGARPGPSTTAATRSVLTLVYDSPYERSDVIASSLHRALIQKRYDSMTVTYHDHMQAIDMLRAGRRYDACVLQPRTSVIHASVLALLRDISDSVIIEGQMADGLDVDAISNDPATCVQIALKHLTELGHRRIAWVSEENNQNFFRLCVRFFEAARTLIGADAAAMPALFAPMRKTERNFEDLPGALKPLFDKGAAGAPTAVVVASFSDGATVAGAFEKLGLSIPRDVSVIKIGTPDVPSDHIGRLAVIGRPTDQVTRSVLERLEWRWRHRTAPFETVLDQPAFAPRSSTAPPRRRR
jgi:DNA-binding LacI/PurR family transcriptional regulator